MKFIKDILIIQTEASGTNLAQDNIIQLSAILLDKDNLLEKQNFNKYIKASFLDKTISEHANFLGIDFETMRKSPKLAEVIDSFVNTFGYTPLLAGHSITSYLFLQQAFKKTFTKFEYDSHFLDIWSLGYVYMLHYGLKKIPTLGTIATHFNLKINHPNNALEKARLAAHVLRKIIQG